MQKATLYDKATGKAVRHVEASRAEAFAAYESRFDVVLGHHELAPKPEVQTAEVKSERNRLLNEHSWTVTNHSPLTGQNKAAWMQYLRALHKVTKEPFDPANVTWPTPPAGYEYEP